MSKIRASKIKTILFYKKVCGFFWVLFVGFAGLCLLFYGFSLIGLSAVESSSELAKNIHDPKRINASFASFYAITGSAMLGGAIAISGIIMQRRTARSKNTIDFEAALEDSEHYNKSYERVKRVVAKREKFPIADWADDDESLSDEANSIKTVLNYWERASNGVRKNVYDGDFLYDIYGSHVLNLYKFLLPFIRRVRQDSQSKAYEQFLIICEGWRLKRKAEDSKVEKNKMKKKNRKGKMEERRLE